MNMHMFNRGFHAAMNHSFRKPPADVVGNDASDWLEGYDDYYDNNSDSVRENVRYSDEHSDDL